jgi:hypothetical protein
MSSQAVRAATAPAPVVDALDGVRLGRLIGFDDGGRPLVLCAEGGSELPLVARVATSQLRPIAGELDPAPTVLLLFENGDAALPIIVGVVRDTFAPAPPPRQVAVISEPGRAIELNGKAVIVEGQDEIVLRCGLGSLTIRADGQIVLKGTRLVSRASETNKIRGASVQIN